MDKATTSSVIGTILGLAAGIIGMLVFSPPPADTGADERNAAIVRERDTALADADKANADLLAEIDRRKKSDQSALDMADKLERLANEKGDGSADAKEWKDKHDKLKAEADEAQRNKNARISKLEGLLDENGIYEYLSDEEIAARVATLKTSFETAFTGKDKKAAMQAIWDMQKLGPKAYDDVIDVWQKMAEDFGLNPWGGGAATMGLNMQEFVALISRFDLVEYGLTAKEMDPAFRINALYGLPWWANEDSGKRAKMAGDVLSVAQGYEAEAAISALRDIPDPVTARYLTDYLASNTDNPKARIEAINALAAKNTPAGWAAIEGAAGNDSDPDVQAAAQTALIQQNITVAGVLVTQVLDNYQAAIAGIKKGDILTHYNGERIKTMAELGTAKSKVAEGQTVQIIVRRGDKDETLTLGSGMIGINGVNVAPKEE